MQHSSKDRYPQARKRFGQNFLHDDSVIDAIISAINVNREQHIVEIGPGRGALTAPLIASGALLDVVELDRDLIPILTAQFSQNPQFHIHQADALKFDYRALSRAYEKLRVIGNLPYNITTPLLFHLLSQSDVIEDMCFMLQREVVERICAEPGSKRYGRLSIMIQYQCDAELLFLVPPEAFDPIPKVESAIIYMQPKRSALAEQVDVVALNKLVTQAFNQRRKTLANTLKNNVSVAQLEALDIDPTQRPEMVSVAQYVQLAQSLAR